MKILRLEAENIKRLRAVTIEPDPDGNLVVIAGKNGQGKSSTLDSIWYALGGGQALRDTARPVRDGEDHARVELDLGDLVVTRTWTGDKPSTLVVKAKDGAKYSSPQALLDGLTGKLSFDPLAFAQQDPKTQLATLTSLVELPFDPAELDRQRVGLFDERTEVGRQVRQLEGQLAGMPDVDTEGLPPNEVSLTDLLARREAAVEQKNANDQKRAQEVSLAGACVVAEADVERFRDSLKRAEEVLAQRAAELEQIRADVADLEDPDIDLLDTRLRTLDETNRKVREATAREELAEKLAAVTAAQHNLTQQISDLDAKKAAAIAAASMPIEGLGFDADGVLYQGVPFKQASSAEQLRVSVAMAMALNPKVRVIRIADGSLLDSDNLKLIEEMAAEHDFQCWIEKVDDTGQVGIVIEDGQVREPANA